MKRIFGICVRVCTLHKLDSYFCPFTSPAFFFSGVSLIFFVVSYLRANMDLFFPSFSRHAIDANQQQQK